MPGVACRDAPGQRRSPGPAVVGREGEQGQVTSPFDGLCQLALMAGTGASLPPRPDLPTITQKPTQCLRILVVNPRALIHAELALPYPPPPSSARPLTSAAATLSRTRS